MVVKPKSNFKPFQKNNKPISVDTSTNHNQEKQEREFQIFKLFIRYLQIGYTRNIRLAEHNKTILDLTYHHNIV